MDLARLGVRAAVCGKIGDDAFGRFVTATLEAAGVDVRGLSVHPRLPTSQTLILNVRGEDRRFIHSFGANAALSLADLDRVLDPVPRVLYVGGYLILPGLVPEGLAERFAEARRRGAVTVLDVACPGPANYLEQLRPVLPETDVFLPNADEAALILGVSDMAEQARRFYDLGAKHVVITDGDEGALAWSERLRVRLGTYPVPYVDGSGSGDAFDAGYIAGLLDGLDELGCLKLASAIGASCVRAVGTTAGVFTRSEADDFVRSHPLEVRPVGAAGGG
jgi:sugar/nucleoside kinase (ribokinase family)